MSVANPLAPNAGEERDPPQFQPVGCTAAGYPLQPTNDIPLTTQPDATVKYPEHGETGAGENLMQLPPGIPVYPPGLKYLTMVDQLLVHHEVLSGCETRNKYDIKNSMEQIVFTAMEVPVFDSCTRSCFGVLRPFEMPIKDHTGKEVINLYRELRCMGCCCPCCMQVIEISSPPGNLIGRVKQEWSICKPKYRVENAGGDGLFQITGRICTACICRADSEFPILASNGLQIGKITKQFSDLFDDDDFGITFPIDLDVTMKAVLLGAVFLIDFNYFERE